MTSVLVLPLDIQPARAFESIYIRPDGSVEGTTSIVSSDNVTYVFTSDINGSIVVQRNNIILDGNGHALQGLGNDTGIYLFVRTNVTVQNTQIKNYSWGIEAMSSSGISIEGNNIENNHYNGIWLAGSSNTITGNNITANTRSGIYSYSGTNDSIYGNNISANNQAGIYYDFCNNTRISGNNITANNEYGIYLANSYYNTIDGNSIANSFDGVVVMSNSNGNSISKNNITNNTYGIYFGYSSDHNNVTWNSLTANEYGIGISNSQYINISGNNIGANSFGIHFYCSNNSIIGENKITNNVWHGIWLTWGSTNNSIIGNSLIANNSTGIYFSQSSDNNRMSGNNVTANNQYGICFGYSSNNNRIDGNNIAYNQYGIGIWSSSDNSVYHNNFINNPSGQAYLDNPTNQWDNDYPSGGNYWSHYSNSTDLFRGVSQNETGADGIADQSLQINSNNTDHYPLMGPFGSSTMTGSNVTVFPASDVGLIFQNVSVSGSTTATEAASGPPPPSGLVSAGPFHNIDTTANYSGNTTVRIIYDDSSMTLEQEGSLSMERWDPSNASLYDVNGDWKEDAKDVYRVGKAYGTSLEGPNPPGRKYDPPCDFNQDGKIDMKDYYMVQKYYGQPTGTWVTITTYVDTASNVIYGETSHFSGIGVHYFR